MSRKEKEALFNNLQVVLMHLLKYRYQSSKRSNSWRFSIREHRKRIERAFRNSPSLKPYLIEIFAECYQDARELAADELSHLLGRVVDLRTPADLSRYFRDRVLQEAVVIYEQD
jgi:hypothetical protein